MTTNFDFQNKKLTWKCQHLTPDIDGTITDIGCGKEHEETFDNLKNQIYNHHLRINCEKWECFLEDGIYNHYPKDYVGHEPCSHCDTYDNISLQVLVLNLELLSDRNTQVNPDVWENNRQYHILRRMLEYGKEYEEVKDEPDLYEQVHKIVGRKAFHKIWVEHENGIKDIREYLK